MIKLATLSFILSMLLGCQNDNISQYALIDWKANARLLRVDSTDEVIVYNIYQPQDTLLVETYTINSHNALFRSQKPQRDGVMGQYFAGIDTSVLFSADITDGGTMTNLVGDPYLLYFPPNVNSFCIDDSIYIRLVPLIQADLAILSIAASGNTIFDQEFSLTHGDTLGLAVISSASPIDTLRMYLNSTKVDEDNHQIQHFSDIVMHLAACESP